MTSVASGDMLDPASEDFNETRPSFYIGQHDSDRLVPLNHDQYNQVLTAGFHFVTSPITNRHFQDRVVNLWRSYLTEADNHGLSEEEKSNPSLPGPIVPTLTDKDTALFPGDDGSTSVAYSSPWIDLCSEDPVVASISRQVLNLEVAYANFCGVRSVIVPGPRRDESGWQISQYARAIQETFMIATRVNLIIHMPMYREPGLEEKEPLFSGQDIQEEASEGEIDIFSAWDSWHTIRTVCDYNIRLYVALRIPRRLPERELQTRWFAEPLHYLTLGPNTFQTNGAGFPSLTRYHQAMIDMYMRLKQAPWMILYDVGPTQDELSKIVGSNSSAADFPTLAEAKSIQEHPQSRMNAHVSYMRYLERQQPPHTALESPALTSFQDWLQSPLQPLADNLESSTYETFEGDPVKYDQYEKAITEAMAEWKALGKPTSSLQPDGDAQQELIVAVAGAGRGPLVTRVLRASEKTGVPIQLWALEKNQNAFVYLLRQNKETWGGKVNVIQTDMREWNGPVARGHTDRTTTVDILVTELLGSFADNELSPECLDGIQRHLARPHGLSIPHSYTAHLSPISYPKIYADLSSRIVGDPNAFETPWVVRLFAIDFVCQKAPGHHRFQQAWEFVHPVRLPFVETWEVGHGRRKVQRGGGGAMNLSAGLNEHNARQCHLTFVCRSRGVIHGLAGYFESVLYKPQMPDKELIEISTLPEQIDKKSKDMISWFPIFFPLKKPLYFPPDSELEVSMWRQTDDTKVWYEWIVEAYMWVGPKTRVKVGASEMHSSRNVACLM